MKKLSLFISVCFICGGISLASPAINIKQAKQSDKKVVKKTPKAVPPMKQGKGMLPPKPAKTGKVKTTK